MYEKELYDHEESKLGKVFGLSKEEQEKTAEAALAVSKALMGADKTSKAIVSIQGIIDSVGSFNAAYAMVLFVIFINDQKLESVK